MSGFRTKSGGVSASGRRAAQAKGQTMPGGGFPIRNASDLKNAKQSIGRAKNPAAARRWINKRAHELGKPPIGKSNGGSIISDAASDENQQQMDDLALQRVGVKKRGGAVEGKARRPHLGRAHR
jgi:hypothetical protein